MIRITYVRLAGRYRIDEVADDGVVRTEISPAVSDEAFAEHLAALVADFHHLGMSRGAIDEDGVVLEWERCPHCDKRASLKARISGCCLDHDVTRLQVRAIAGPGPDTVVLEPSGQARAGRREGRQTQPRLAPPQAARLIP